MANPLAIGPPTGQEGQQVEGWLKLAVDALKFFGTFASGYFVHWLTNRSDLKKARIAFQSAFTNAIAILDGLGRLYGIHLPMQSFQATIANQDTAIAEFRLHLGRRKRARFDKDCQKYKMERTMVASSEDIGGARYDSKQKLILSIKKLLSYAE